MNTPTKVCYICKAELPATSDNFTKDKSRADGFHPYCKPCRNAKRAEHRHTNPDLMEKARARARKWFNENKERARERARKDYRQNKKRYKQKSKEWRKNNPERYKENNRIYKHKHFRDNREMYNSYTRNRRALLKNADGSHTAKDINKLYKSQNGLCAYCGISLADGYHVDHVIPISRGGSNYPSNLALACASCNCSKNDRLLSEWLSQD